MLTKEFLLASSIALGTALGGMAQAAENSQPATVAPTQSGQANKASHAQAGKKTAQMTQHKIHRQASKKDHPAKPPA